MNTIDRFSSATESDYSLGNRDSVDTRWTMSDDRNVQSSPASSIAIEQDAQDHDDACARDQYSCSEGHRSFEELDFVELSDDPPTKEQLEQADDIQMYDAEGNARPFHSLYRGPEHQGRRQLLIFIRHFYCGACQAYVQRLCETITPTAYFSLTVPTTITIIGMGKANLIPAHATRTHCPFRMYTEPTRKLYKLFGMTHTVRWGKRPDYMKDNIPKMTYKAFAQMVKAGRKDGLAGGPMTQIGGEFLFEEGAPVWCHRMRAIRDHADFKTLRRVLDMEEEEEELVTPTREKDKRKTVDKITQVEGDKPRGLRLVYETGTPEGEIRRARLGRESRDINR